MLPAFWVPRNRPPVSGRDQLVWVGKMLTAPISTLMVLLALYWSSTEGRKCGSRGNHLRHFVASWRCLH